MLFIHCLKSAITMFLISFSERAKSTEKTSVNLNYSDQTEEVRNLHHKELGKVG